MTEYKRKTSVQKGNPFGAFTSEDDDIEQGVSKAHLDSTPSASCGFCQSSLSTCFRCGHSEMYTPFPMVRTSDRSCLSECIGYPAAELSHKVFMPMADCQLVILRDPNQSKRHFHRLHVNAKYEPLRDFCARIPCVYLRQVPHKNEFKNPKHILRFPCLNLQYRMFFSELIDAMFSIHSRGYKIKVIHEDDVFAFDNKLFLAAPCLMKLSTDQVISRMEKAEDFTSLATFVDNLLNSNSNSSGRIDCPSAREFSNDLRDYKLNQTPDYAAFMKSHYGILYPQDKIQLLINIHSAQHQENNKWDKAVEKSTIIKEEEEKETCNSVFLTSYIYDIFEELRINSEVQTKPYSLDDQQSLVRLLRNAAAHLTDARWNHYIKLKKEEEEEEKQKEKERQKKKGKEKWEKKWKSSQLSTPTNLFLTLDDVEIIIDAVYKRSPSRIQKSMAKHGIYKSIWPRAYTR